MYADQPLTKKQRSSSDAYFCHHVIHKRDFAAPPPAEGGAGEPPAASAAVPAPSAAAPAAAGQENERPAQAAGNAGAAPPGAKRHFLFHDETLPTFFRRPSWSPDGSLLAAPAGMFQKSPSSSVLNTTHVFARSSLPKPLFHLPRHSRPTVAVRFCPVIFRRGAGGDGPLDLPYKLVWAVATIDSVIFYDSSSAQAFAVVSALHMAAITDVAWASDASYVVVSSHDGYCSTISFENDELGEPLPAGEYPAHLREALQRARTAAAAAAAEPADAAAAPPAEPVVKRRRKDGEEGGGKGADAGADAAAGAGADAGPTTVPANGVSASNAAHDADPQARRVQAEPVVPGSCVPAPNL